VSLHTRINFYIQATERNTMRGENDASNSAYCCVGFPQPVAYISQPKALCAGELYYVDSIIKIRVKKE
jgi:hypothetical protein